MAYRLACWTLLLLACFYGIGAYPLLDNNEGMYAAIARAMLRSGDVIIPRLNGVPYLEKPPLFYWLMAASMGLFGVNTWAVRLVPALALFGTAWLMRRFTIRITGSNSAGFTAALIFATSLPLLMIGRMVMCDMAMVFFLSAALMAFYRWYDSSSDKPLLYFYAFLALAVLTKGFVTLVLTGGGILLFLLWQRSPLILYRKLLDPRGMLLFLLIAAPWHIAASLKQPGFTWFYFINEHLYRFLNMREPHDYYTGHWWYYLPRLLAYLLPWTPFLALLSCAKRSGGAGSQAANGDPALALRAPQDDRLSRFLWSWFLFCLLFFSLSGAKANYYMLTGMPPLIILLALRWDSYTGGRLLPIVASLSLLLLYTAVMLIHILCPDGGGSFAASCAIVSWKTITLFALYAGIAIALFWRLPQRWITPLIAAHVLLTLSLLMAGINSSTESFSQKPVADFLKASGYHDVALFQHFEKWSALAFYLDRPLFVVDSQSEELLYGHCLGANPGHFLTLEQWAAHNPPIPMVILAHKAAPVMAMLPQVKTCVLKRFERVAVIGVCR